MPFTSLLFLFAFLPAFLLVYWVAPTRAKNLIALGFSILFYGWGAPTFLPVVLALGVIDFYLAHAIADASSQARKKWLLAIGVTMHLSVLCYFKYSNFFVDELNGLVGALGGGFKIPWSHVALPIGVSFLTFEEISCLVDVYRKDARPARTMSQYLLFLMLFPHSIAGPIFRWKDLEAQLDSRTLDEAQIVYGARRFAIGLAKKALIANAVAVTADAAFTMKGGELSTGVAWLGIVAYALEIFFDFSGYSDMAIGLGHMLGFRFKDNFDSPYISLSITEFWRRWHISLSSWLRDYLFIPLGGSRAGEPRVIFNLMTTFLLSGLWHGANWTFVIWGGYHGVLSAIERTGAAKRARAVLPSAANLAITFVLVLVGWVFFRADSAANAGRYLTAMFHWTPVTSAPLAWAQVLPTRSLAAGLVGLALALGPALTRRADDTPGAPKRSVTEGGVWAFALGMACLLLSAAYLANSKFQPLIYFKF